MTNIELILLFYPIIAVISAICTALFMWDYEIKGIDNFWDWIRYNIFWIIKPIKAIIKFFRNII